MLFTALIVSLGYLWFSWGLRQSGPTDPPMENGHKFAPTAPFASKFLLGNTR